MIDAYSYKGKTPEGWKRLFDEAERATRGSSLEGRLASGQVNPVLSRVRSLDNRTLEHLRFFGFGQVVSPVGRYLAQPDIRANTLNVASRLLVEAGRKRAMPRQRPGVRLLDLDAVNFREPFIGAAMKARAALPLGTLLLTDCLQFESLQRRKALMKHCPNVLPKFRDIQDLTVSAESAGTSAMLNATGLYRGVLANAYMIRHNLTFNETVARDPLVSEIKSPKGLRGVKLLKAATYIAKLRIDEVQQSSIVGECLSLSAHNELEFEQPGPPPPIDNSIAESVTEVLIHEERFGCPAVFCGPVIADMLDNLPGIIIGANQLALSSMAA